MEQTLIQKTEWPMYLSLEQREQLVAGKIARAVAAAKTAAPPNIAYHGLNQNKTADPKHIFN